MVAGHEELGKRNGKRLKQEQQDQKGPGRFLGTSLCGKGWEAGLPSGHLGCRGLPLPLQSPALATGFQSGGTDKILNSTNRFS